MTKLLKKDEYQLKGHSDYHYKSLIFKFLDIGLFESKEIKKSSYEKFFSNLDLDQKDVVRIVALLKKDSVLLEMVQMWINQETLFNMKFLESVYLKIFPTQIHHLNCLKYLFIRI